MRNSNLMLKSSFVAPWRRATDTSAEGFNTALLASVVADLGHVDEACSLGAEVTRMVSDVRSVRSMAYLSGLARRLNRFKQNAEVNELYELMVGAGIPVPSEA
jgi:hypothetical protein